MNTYVPAMPSDIYYNKKCYAYIVSNHEKIEKIYNSVNISAFIYNRYFFNIQLQYFYKLLFIQFFNIQLQYFYKLLFICNSITIARIQYFYVKYKNALLDPMDLKIH